MYIFTCTVLRAVQATQRPGQTDQTRPITAKSDTSGGWWRFLSSKTRLWRVEWRVLVSKTRATQSDQQMLKKMPKFPRSGDFLVFLSSDSATLGLPLLRSDGICSNSLKSSQDLLSFSVSFAQIRRHIGRSDSDQWR